MAISLESFIEKTNAEQVGGLLILGEQAARRKVGEYSPVFTLNEDGQAIAAALEQEEAAKRPVISVKK